MFNNTLNRKAAADHAAKHLCELVPVVGTPVVEEHFQHDGFWQITLSFVPGGAGTPAGHGARKEFKTFTIDARTGEVVAMKIRSIEP